MRRLYLLLRCIVLWIVSAVHFFPGGVLLIVMAVLVDPRKNDLPQRIFARNVVRLAGARLRVESAPGFDPKRTCIFISNHVNLFDPFVLYSSVPQFVRGWELESHFKIPVYGWMMKRFGNVPVPDQKTPGGLRRMMQLTRKSLDGGTSLIVFPEGSRTRDGRVQPFQKGIFRMVRDLGYPIVPVSMVGSFEFNRKDSWMLFPSTIVVQIHQPIETTKLSRGELDGLLERVQSIVSAPVNGAVRSSVDERVAD